MFNLYQCNNSTTSDIGPAAEEENHMDAQFMRNSKNFTLSPETTDYDSNCGDLDSFSNDLCTGMTDYGRLYTSMPVLEDGLSSGHASDTESHGHNGSQVRDNELSSSPCPVYDHRDCKEPHSNNDDDKTATLQDNKSRDIQAALKDIQKTIQRTKVLPAADQRASSPSAAAEHHSPVWIPRLSASAESLNSDYVHTKEVGVLGGDDDELDTDLETDRLLGQQRLADDHEMYQDDNWVLRNKLNLGAAAAFQSSALRQGVGSTLLPTESPTGSKAQSTGNGENSPERGARGDSGADDDKSPTESLKLKQDAQGKAKPRNKEGQTIFWIIHFL